MFKRLKDFFTGRGDLRFDTSNGVSEEELQTAVGVLLLEMAGRDSDYAPEEVKAIFGVLQKRYKLSEARTMEILEVAEAARMESDKIDKFVGAINDRYSSKQKEQLLTMIWRVVLADGKIEKHEERFFTQMKFRLKLNDEQAERARKAAKSG